MTDDLTRDARKITLTLLAAQSLGSAGFIAAATLNALVGAKLGGGPAWAGVPSAVYLLGAAGAALLWGYLMEPLGRRGALVLGLLLGSAGAGMAFVAVMQGALPLFLAGLLLMGVASAALALARFAAAEVHAPGERGRAISNVVIGGTAGAVFGPLMVGPAGQWAQGFGADELAGAYAASLLLFALAGGVVYLLLRPDPRDLGRQVAAMYPETGTGDGAARALSGVLLQPASLVAMASMVLGQMVMVMVMTITSVHMRGHAHGLGDVSIVISAHTVGMYAFSIVSGRLADRWGRPPVILAGAGLLLAACLAAQVSPDVLPLALALFLLGLGWNLCFVGGSALLADQLRPPERTRAQGFNDLLVGLASTAGSLGSGLIFAAVGFGVMALIGAGVAFVLLGATAGWRLAAR